MEGKLLCLAAAFIAVFILFGCTGENQQITQENNSVEFSGEKLAINTLITNNDGSGTGIIKVDSNRFSINPRLSRKQKILITIGNRSGQSIYFRDSEFSCLGRNYDKNSNAALVLEDSYFECVNCPYKRTCRLGDGSSSYDSDSNCYFDKGEKIFAIESGQGINLVAVVIPSENLWGTALCTLSVETYAEKKEVSFVIDYSAKDV